MRLLMNRNRATSAEKTAQDTNTNRNRIRDNIKDALSSFIWKRIKRSPMILPIIMEDNEV